MKPLIAHLGNVWNVYGPMAHGSGETIAAAWHDYVYKIRKVKIAMLTRRAVAIREAPRCAKLRQLLRALGR
jgi:hypothetical protein